MRLGGWLALSIALWAGAAGAQMIEDPTPDPDDPTDWELGLEPEAVASGLDTPTGLVFVGTRADEDLLVLEKNTGKVRHFKDRTPQGDALDLGVDNCGERGLLSIALHPEFDRGTPTTSDPLAPKKDWVYLAYHTDAGQTGDDCDAGATFRVARYTWNGTSLVDEVVVFSMELADGEDTLVGGHIGFTQDFDSDEPDFIGARLFIAIGSLGRNGSLQNNKAIQPRVLDDTSVLLRLKDDGTTPEGNPFDTGPESEPEGPEDRYFGYGFRDARAIAPDPLSSTVFLSERSDGGFDEIDVFPCIQPVVCGVNSGFDSYKGFVPGELPRNIEDDLPNPDYLLVDLLFTNETEPEPISTYLNPPFTFESAEVKPTGLAIGGFEVGPQHREDLFVGTEDGRLFRFDVNRLRLGFTLAPPLADVVANLNTGVVDNPQTPDVDESLPDDLTQILIATGFGAISDLETGIDGSLYVVDQEHGTVRHIFYDAIRDLAVQSVKAPTKISLSAKKPVVSKSIKVTLTNPGEVAERILGTNEASLQAELEDLLGLEITSPTGCAAPTTNVVVPKYARDPYPPVIGIAPGGRLSLEVKVDWTCASPSPAGVADFETTVTLDMNAIGIIELDENKADNVCPRAATGDDPGCGAKGGGDILTDVIQK
jgi:glucose/arabinose dehydrogenase